MNVKKQKTTTRVVVTCVVAVGATGFVVGTTLQFIPEKSTALVTQFSAEATETSISYTVEATVNVGNSLYIRLHNQFTDRKEEIDSGKVVTGEFLNLAKHMDYKITLYENSISIKTINISTYSE